ncbi:MAG: hypothetical protein ACK4UZ_02845, partial [Rhizobium rhizophilum]
PDFIDTADGTGHPGDLPGAENLNQEWFLMPTAAPRARPFSFRPKIPHDTPFKATAKSVN